MKIFLDCGCYNGDSIEFMIKKKIIDENFKVIGFDLHNMEKELSRYNKLFFSFEYIKKAVWIKNEFRNFAICETGSTLMEKKLTYVRNNKIKVECFDFSEYIKQFKNDYLVVKMDIEGAELPVLKKMIEDKTIFMIDELYLEFHGGKCYDKKSEREITEFILDNKINSYVWMENLNSLMLPIKEKYKENINDC